MTISELTEHVVDLIDAAVLVPVVKTAGRPAHPNAGDCDGARVHVWWENTFNVRQGGPADDFVRSQASIAFEVMVCYPDDDLGETISDESHADVADDFESLVQQVWCAVVNGPKPADCETWRPDRITVQQRSGGIVSAIGYIVTDAFCTVPSS